ncbi:MAG: hypothetical protein COV45_04270 [Deltaproteobacteria bacterium CG11_big_fil_rev_8_21_14_0_20_47_16]|nr:MAG: hypothetical protein COV45_04270 [Deltaproteobacteria bacterium CG11_big_fil_rev_8_21_14_0_20_47_16]
MAKHKKVTRKTARKTPKTKKKAHKKSNGYAASGLGNFLSKLPAQDWFDFASQQRHRLIREVNHLSAEILNKISDSNIFSNHDEIVKDAKDHLDSIVSRLNQSELISRVIDAARGTKNEILSFLNIPSHKELSSLQKRLNQLEKKVSHTRPRARS